MLSVFFDTNVVLDVLLERQPWVETSKRLWAAIDDGRITGYVASTSLTNIFYIARRAKGLEAAFDAVQICLDTFDVSPVVRDVLSRALDARATWRDFEDAVQMICASDTNADMIATRDPSDFQGSPVPALSPADVLARLPPTSTTTGPSEPSLRPAACPG